MRRAKVKTLGRRARRTNPARRRMGATMEAKRRRVWTPSGRRGDGDIAECLPQ